MGKRDKLIQKILDGRSTSYEEAESLLLGMDFELNVKGSHHVFRKPGYERTVSIKRRKELFPYQLRDLQEVLKDHGH